MLVRIIIEGIGLSILLFIMCAVGIKDGAVGMVHMYHKDVQDKCVEMELTTYERIRKRGKVMKLCGMLIYLVYVLTVVYVVDGIRGFLPGFLHIFAILSIMNLFDRLVIDGYWVGHTKAWTIPGTEEYKPYINQKDKAVKWAIGTASFAVLAAAVSAAMEAAVKIF